jgi:methyl coenzyme M reductase subunit C-like uncharacterized protein (methanogenesis marker protein 7)
MAIKHMKLCPQLLVTKEMQIKTTVISKMAIRRRVKENQRVVTSGPLTLQLDRRVVQPLWKWLESFSKIKHGST